MALSFSLSLLAAPGNRSVLLLAYLYVSAESRMLFPVTDGSAVSFKELPVVVILFSRKTLRGSSCGNANNVRVLVLSETHLIP